MKTYRHCEHCQQIYKAATVRSRYCSGACRAKASRKAHGAIVDNPSLASIKRTATKRAHLSAATCEHCGATYARTGVQAMKRFCTAECRQAAWKQAHRNKAKEDVGIVIPNAYRALDKDINEGETSARAYNAAFVRAEGR